jgi:hypothetical protein
MMKTWRPVGKMRFCNILRVLSRNYSVFWIFLDYYQQEADVPLLCTYLDQICVQTTRLRLAALLRRKILTAVYTWEQCGFLFQTSLVEQWLEHMGLSIRPMLHVIFTVALRFCRLGSKLVSYVDRGLNGRELFRFPIRGRDFPFSKMPRTALGPPCSVYTKRTFPAGGSKHPPPFTSERKNERSHTYILAYAFVVCKGTAFTPIRVLLTDGKRSSVIFCLFRNPVVDIDNLWGDVL